MTHRVLSFAPLVIHSPIGSAMRLLPLLTLFCFYGVVHSSPHFLRPRPSTEEPSYATDALPPPQGYGRLSECGYEFVADAAGQKKWVPKAPCTDPNDPREKLTDFKTGEERSAVECGYVVVTDAAGQKKWVPKAPCTDPNDPREKLTDFKTGEKRSAVECDYEFVADAAGQKKWVPKAPCTDPNDPREKLTDFKTDE